MDDFKKQALEEINAKVHNKGTIEILDEEKYYYKFLFLEIHVDNNFNTIFKLLELSDTEFNEDNKIYRFSIQELITGRISFLKRESNKNEKIQKLFSNTKKIC